MKNGTLEGYVEMLAEISTTRRAPGRRELEERRSAGATAAEAGISLPSLMAAYHHETYEAWPHLPGPRAAGGLHELRDAAGAVLRAFGDTTVALAEGYQAAQRAMIRREEAERRGVIDDLLSGHVELGHLAERAERFGIRLVGPHRVAVAGAQTPFAEGDPATRYIEEGMGARFGEHDVLLAARDGLLVCVMPSSVPDVARQLADHLHHAGCERNQVAVSRSYPGPNGIVRGYREARDTLELAHRLELDTQILNASDMLVFQVLGRDRAAITDLVGTVLAPLENSRGGPGPLLDTLTAYFSCGCVNAVTARRLGLSVRTIRYRLDRIKHLTGYDPNDPVQRYILQTAALGARLLDWPARPIQLPA